MAVGYPRAGASKEENGELPKHNRDAAEPAVWGRWQRRSRGGADGGHDQADWQSSDGKLPHVRQVEPRRWTDREAEKRRGAERTGESCAAWAGDLGGKSAVQRMSLLWEKQYWRKKVQKDWFSREKVFVHLLWCSLQIKEFFLSNITVSFTFTRIPTSNLHQV